MKQSDIRALCLIDGFRDSDYVAMVNELVPELKSCERGRLQIARASRGCESVIFIGPEKHRGMYNTQELLLLGAHAQRRGAGEGVSAGLTCHDVINMQYTSGTTGFPKGVMLTHHNILNNGFHIGERQKFTEADARSACRCPLFHCFGLVLGHHGHRHARGHGGDRGELRSAPRPGLGPEGEVHGALRRADDVHRGAEPSHVRDVRPVPHSAPASWRARPARWRS